jgi:hypothetical protein
MIASKANRMIMKFHSRRRWGQLLCGALFLSAALPGLAQSRVALLVGNAEYLHARKLINPINDATRLKEKLDAAGYQTILAKDASVAEFSTQLELFYEAAKGAEVAMLFFAGHGIEHEDRNYLLPIDAALSIDENLSGDSLQAAKRSTLKREAILLDTMLADLGRCGAKLKLVVLDCCRDDPLPERSWLSRSSGTGGTLAEVSEKALSEGTMLVFSTSPGKTASDGHGVGNSPFTAAVLNSLQPGASILQVFTNAAGRMDRQEPWIKFDGSGKAMLGFGSFALIPSTSGSTPAGTTPQTPSPPDSNPKVLTAEANRQFLVGNQTKPGIITTESGLQYEVLKEGSGPRPTELAEVTVHYRGTLINGQVFDESYERGEPAIFPLSGVIEGWDEGVQLMRKGAKHRLFIPSALGYGDRGAGDVVPPHSTLIFEVDLISIEEP